MKKFLKIILLIVLVYVLALGTTLMISYTMSIKDIKTYSELQSENIQAHETAYSTNLAQKINEQEFCDFELDELENNRTRINELRYMATHNSYKAGVNNATKFLFNVLLLKKILRFDYSFPTLTEQLNDGIRSFELDMNMIKNKDESSLICAHNPTIDTASNAINIKLALRELKMWSDYNPNHLPIIILVEPKAGIPITNAIDIPKEIFTDFDNTLKDIFGTKLMKPKDMLNNYDNFSQMRKANDYPLIADSLGKFIFIMHESKYVEDYILTDKTFKTQSMFLALTEKTFFKHPDYKNYTAFAISNDPANRDAMNDFIYKDNFIVRTRADAELEINTARWDNAILSNANIISTDFIKGNSKKYLTFNNKTMALRDISLHY